jgi:hypothetical protein
LSSAIFVVAVVLFYLLNYFVSLVADLGDILKKNASPGATKLFGMWFKDAVVEQNGALAKNNNESREDISELNYETTISLLFLQHPLLLKIFSFSILILDLQATLSCISFTIFSSLVTYLSASPIALSSCQN